jgi:hypothetical protein
MSIMSEYSFVTCVVRYARYVQSWLQFLALDMKENKNTWILNAQNLFQICKNILAKTSVARYLSNKKKMQEKQEWRLLESRHTRFLNENGSANIAYARFAIAKYVLALKM